jgi:hypothetical protein
MAEHLWKVCKDFIQYIHNSKTQVYISKHEWSMFLILVIFTGQMGLILEKTILMLGDFLVLPKIKRL